MIILAPDWLLESAARTWTDCRSDLILRAREIVAASLSPSSVWSITYGAEGACRLGRILPFLCQAPGLWAKQVAGQGCTTASSNKKQANVKLVTLNGRSQVSAHVCYHTAGEFREISMLTSSEHSSAHNLIRRNTVLHEKFWQPAICLFLRKDPKKSSG